MDIIEQRSDVSVRDGPLCEPEFPGQAGECREVAAVNIEIRTLLSRTKGIFWPLNVTAKSPALPPSKWAANLNDWSVIGVIPVCEMAVETKPAPANPAEMAAVKSPSITLLL